MVPNGDMLLAAALLAINAADDERYKDMSAKNRREPRVSLVDAAVNHGEARMNEDALNTSVRKFLKEVGLTSQREIEKAVRDAMSSGRLKADALPAKATIKVEALGLTLDVDGAIEVK